MEHGAESWLTWIKLLSRTRPYRQINRSRKWSQFDRWSFCFYLKTEQKPNNQIRENKSFYINGKKRKWIVQSCLDSKKDETRNTEVLSSMRQRLPTQQLCSYFSYRWDLCYKNKITVISLGGAQINLVLGQRAYMRTWPQPLIFVITFWVVSCLVGAWLKQSHLETHWPQVWTRS